MTKDKLAIVLDKHKKWLNAEEGGEHADLSDADLHGADLDFSCWPLWCGSLGVHICERIALQLLYHTLYNIAYSKYISAEIKRVLLTPEIVEIANRSHVVHHHGKPKIEPYKEET